MIHLLNALDVVNWDSVMIDNQKKLCLVVIREFKSERGADGFSKTEQEQYRVLRLEQEGNGEYIYSVQVYTKGEKGNWVGGEKKFPTDYNGNFWTYIPFTFVGAIDNSEEIKKPPLLPLANLNLAHYRDSADFQESVFIWGNLNIMRRVLIGSGMTKPRNVASTLERKYFCLYLKMVV